MSAAMGRAVVELSGTSKRDEAVVAARSTVRRWSWPGGVRLSVTLREGPGRAVRLLVRPERVKLGGAGDNVLAARVASVMYLGDHCEVGLALAGGHRLLATPRGHVPLSPDDSVTVRVAPDAFLDVS